MEFLKNIVLPQPIEHVHLLLFVLNLLFLLFLPYLALALGSTLLSLRYHRRHRALGIPADGDSARHLIELPFLSMGVVLFFGILPAFALVFLFAQLLQGTSAIAAGLMLTGFCALAIAAILLYVYRYNLRLEDALAATGHVRSPAGDLRAHARDLADRSGMWGLFFLLLASVLCVGAITIAVNRAHWTGVESFPGLLITPDFWIRYLQFLSLSGVMTGIGALFFLFEWEGGVADIAPATATELREVFVKLAAVSLLLLPLFVLATLAFLPAASLTGPIFGLSGLHLAFLMLTGILLFAFHREGRGVYVAYAFFAFGVALVLLFTRDQIAVRNATQDQAASLSIAAERELLALRASLGVGAKAMTGQEIFDAKCSACHMFDAKKVGPPYNVVLVKYQGKKGDLIRFVLNPRKVDPAYPVMPNQGLRPPSSLRGSGGRRQSDPRGSTEHGGVIPRSPPRLSRIDEAGADVSLRLYRGGGGASCSPVYG